LAPRGVIDLNRIQALSLLLLAACSSKVDEQVLPAASSAPPADTTDPNSLVEGEAEIFGMRLPSRASVNRRTPLAAGAQIPWQFDRVANYFRERVDAEAVEVGPRNTIFRRAKIKGDPSGDTYNIVVKRTGHTAEVAFRKEMRRNGDAPTEDPTPGGELVVDDLPTRPTASALPTASASAAPLPPRKP
jgi:hypothetical protein